MLYSQAKANPKLAATLKSKNSFIVKKMSTFGDGNYTPSEAVVNEVEKRRQEEEEARRSSKSTLGSRMRKLAGMGSESAGFGTAGLGAEIAEATAEAGEDERNKSGTLSVKSIVARVSRRLSSKSKPAFDDAADEIPEEGKRLSSKSSKASNKLFSSKSQPAFEDVADEIPEETERLSSKLSSKSSKRLSSKSKPAFDAVDEEETPEPTERLSSKMSKSSKSSKRASSKSKLAYE